MRRDAQTKQLWLWVLCNYEQLCFTKKREVEFGTGLLSDGAERVYDATYAIGGDCGLRFSVAECIAGRTARIRAECAGRFGGGDAYKRW